MVFSGGFSSPSVVGPQRAFERKLVEQLGRPVDFQSVYLDLSSGSDDASQRNLAEFLARRYEARPIDLLLVQRVETLAFLLKHRSFLLPGVPIVFTEVSHGELGQVALPPDVTGAVTAGLSRTVPIALDLLPDTQRFVVVAGGTALDRGAAAALQQQLGAAWPGLETERLDGKPFDEQLARVASLPPHSLILFAGYYGEASGRTLVGTRALEELASAANSPIFGFVENLLGAGLTGGDLVQLDVLAERAATLAARILQGEAPESIPPIDDPSSVVAFDARQLERWHIAERRLPAGSVVRFREPTLWTNYRWQVLGALGLLVAQGLLIAGLVVQRRQRRRAVAGLAEAEHRYRTVADFGVDWEYWALPDGSLRYVSPSCEAISGYAAAAFLDRPALMNDIVADEDRDAWRQHRAQGHSGPERRTMEFRIRRADGETRWIEHVCARVTGPDGSDMGTRGSNRDITARKQAEEDLRRALREIEELRDRLELDNSYLREQLHPEGGIEGILGASDAMRYATAKAQQVAKTTSTVLLLGETGVGKSLLAQAIHDLSPRRARPLVTLDCAALPSSLIESELFGHEKGAFTGAQAMRRGRFEIADGGTLFLDEIAELPLDLQGRLLRAVQDGRFERVGSSVTRRTDVRLIAATNRRLDDEVRAGRFRQDLLYRLNVFPITVPPLRQRPDDIPLLTAHFLQKHCRRLGVPVPPVSKATMKALQAREWPGNVRELENVIERVLITSRGTRFELGGEVASHDDAVPAARNLPGAPRTLAQLERDHIVATLEQLEWRIEGAGGAAEALGINASTLRSRMQKHGIRRPVAGTDKERANPSRGAISAP
jgi:PAS domain S-box-containing protein